MKRRAVLQMIGMTFLGGCTQPALRSQSPEDLTEAISDVRLIEDTAVPYGLNYLKVEAPVLITGLPGTGSNPGPSALRSAVLAEMQTHHADKPNQVLSSLTTSIAVAHTLIPPGATKGDRADVEIRVAPDSDTSSLAGGHLMPAQLREMAVLGGTIHDGHLQAAAAGPLLVDPTADPEKNPVALKKARVLGGARVLRERPMGLVLRPDMENTLLSKQIGEVINARFYTYSKGVQVGVAKPKTDQFIELKVHPRYKDNIVRYIQVVRSISIRETPQQRLERMQLLQRQLLDPLTTQMAALRLEAIGRDAIRILKEGVADSDPEVRYYCAEALAYLDDPTGIETLARAARQTPAFRAHALTALSTMQDISSYDALRDLLGVDSVETRYGAFRALWAKDSRDPLVRGENLRGQFSYHLLETSGPPLVHISASRRPEIVLFRRDIRLSPPLVLTAGRDLMINARRHDEIVVNRFAVGQGNDQQRIVSTRLDDVIRAIVDLGGTYCDVAQVLQQADAHGALQARLAVDALPKTGRRYERSDEDEPGNAPQFQVDRPTPNLYSQSGE